MTPRRLAIALLLTPPVTLAALTARSALSWGGSASGLLELTIESVERFSVVEVLTLIAGGLLLRAIAGPDSGTTTGAAMLVPGIAFLTPVTLSLSDVLIRGASHNLLGLEWILYAAFAAFVWLGFGLGTRLANQRL